MFSGIIESLGQIKAIEKNGSNIDFTVACTFIDEVYIDQSIAHDGVCLTVVTIYPESHSYKITAVEETLNITSLKNWTEGKSVNLERCLKMGDRLDGHFVQGHVDAVSACRKIEVLDGSWYFTFDLALTYRQLVVNKGSITVNGTSLTAILTNDESEFKIAIIPYTYHHTNFQYMQVGDEVNLEFDVLGKYVLRAMDLRSIP